MDPPTGPPGRRRHPARASRRRGAPGASGLDKLKEHTAALHTWSLSIIDGYKSGDDIRFPDRLHLSVLLATFELELFTMIEHWADFALDEVVRWSDTTQPGPHTRTAALTDILAARQTILGQRRNRGNITVSIRSGQLQTSGAMNAQVGDPDVVASSQLNHLVERGDDPSVQPVQNTC